MKLSIFKRSLTLAIPFALISALNAYAVPSINSTSGSFIHGATVTVNGTGFGTKSPVAPAIWDSLTMANYNGLSNGSAIPVPNTIWSGYGGGIPCYYKTSNPRGKWTAHYSNQWSTDSAKKGALDGGVVTGATTSKKLYATWWLYSSSDPTVGGTNSSNKWVRVVSGDWATTGNGSVIWEPGSSPRIFSFEFTGNTYPGSGYLSTGTNTAAWNRMELFVDSTGANSPVFTASTNNVSGGTFTSSPSQSWVLYRLDSIGFDGSNTDASQQPTIDWGEIYADNTPARVEVCNASTKSSSNHCEIQIPTTQWVDGTLQVNVNQGSFADGSTAYLYVIDASGNASAGKQITFGSSGGGGGGTTPPAVKNVKATVTSSN